MGFFEHLDELRRRLFLAALALLLGFAACYPFRLRLFAYLSRPIESLLEPGQSLAFIRLTEPFLVQLKVAALAGIFVASPFLLLQVWQFVAPGLYRHERRSALLFVAPATVCFGLGGAFAFTFLLPAMCRFFLEQGHGYQMVVTLDDYFSLLFWTILGVGLSFELPVALGLLGRMGLVRSRTLVRRLDLALVACLIAAAVITPTPDAMTMVFVAAPLLALYAISILVVRVLEPGAEPGGEPSP
jgi:sec-independent protein translocase protein TatC